MANWNRFTHGGVYVTHKDTSPRKRFDGGAQLVDKAVAIRSTGASAGIATVTGVSRALVRVDGVAAGFAVVEGVGRRGVRATGVVAAVGTVTGVAYTKAKGAGTANGSSTAVAIGLLTPPPGRKQVSASCTFVSYLGAGGRKRVADGGRAFVSFRQNRRSIGNASGLGIAEGAGYANARGAGSATGQGSVTGAGKARYIRSFKRITPAGVFMSHGNLVLRKYSQASRSSLLTVAMWQPVVSRGMLLVMLMSNR